MKRKLTLTLALLVVSLGLCAIANAQGKLFGGVNWRERVEAAKNGNAQINKESLARVEAAYAEKAEAVNENNSSSANGLVGTWYCTVPGPTPADNFYAYQTFGTEGTFVETSSILVTLTEGPAHGVWEKVGQGYLLTFELFAFDPEAGAQVGRIRVRNYLRLTSRNNFTADGVVDFIELDGTVIPNIGAGPFYGERVQVRGL